MTLQEKHIELVEAVNNAKTLVEHQTAETRLRGFRDALEAYRTDAGYGQMLMDCDMHYIRQGIDRPMCCGVFSDWEPAA